MISNTAASSSATMEDSASTSQEQFFDRYVDLQPFELIVGLPAYQATDLNTGAQVLLRCFRLPWDVGLLEQAIMFGESDDPFMLPLTDLVQFPTEIILVSELVGSSFDKWARHESISMVDLERFAGQIGSGIQNFKPDGEANIIISPEVLRISHTPIGKPYCRIMGGRIGTSPAEAILAMRELIGSKLLWDQQRKPFQVSADTSRRFTADSSIDELSIDPKSWLGWLLADYEELRPPSINHWLEGKDRRPAVSNHAHHLINSFEEKKSFWPGLKD